jgi:2-polyprenyl-6-methoxyphenol hydroxylase-like FAD-dependent oxidoreductase
MLRGMRVAVVGAGLGGVSAAVGLHRRGHEVALYERAPELREAGTAIVIMPNGVRALDALELGDCVRGRAMPAVSGGCGTGAGGPCWSPTRPRRSGRSARPWS